MNKELKGSLKTFAVELLVYAVLITGYYFLVLHLIGPWLYHLFQTDRRWYTGAALACIIAQGVLLESITRQLVLFFTPRPEG